MSSPDPLLQTLLRDPTAGVLSAAANGTVLRANDTLRQMLPEDAALRPGAPLGGVFALADREDATRALADCLATGAPRALLARLAGAEAEPHHAVAVTVLPLPIEGAEPRLLLRLTDVTAQRRLEAQLAHGQKLQALGQLAGGIAHDFNNLLTVILGATEAAGERRRLDKTTRAEIAQIRRAAERGSALVRQLLAFGRQQALQPRVIALNEAVTDIADMLRRLLGKEVRLELELEQPGRWVKVDPTQLDQVLVNLAVNARDAMPQGGTLTLRSGHVSLYRPLARGAETIPPGDYAMLDVRDTGSGIPPDVLPRIFDPFFTTRRAQGGTGLGLATVHGIVRQSDGFLTVDSVPGEGTSLRVYLPLRAAPAAAPAPAPEPDPMPEPPGRAVLLVDDEDMVRALLARALRARGWEVLEADSGESALESVAGTRLAAVISDVAMPGMDGPVLVRELRARQPDLPAILISGYVAESQRAALETDKIAFLAKPYSMKDALALLAEVTGQKEPAGSAA